MNDVALAPHVQLGAPGQPVVHVPGRGTLVIDPGTHDFLLTLKHGDASPLSRSDPDTARSLALLVAHGVLAESRQPISSSVVAHRYVPNLTDLTARRPVRALERLVVNAAATLAPAWNGAVVGAGFGLLLLCSISWALFLPAGPLIHAWASDFFPCILLVAAAQIVRLLLHEAGHCAVALRVGGRPTVGVGIYFTGLVAYTDLSSLDTADRRHRMSGDLGGSAADGGMGAALTAAALATQSPVLGCVAVSVCSVGMASLEPWGKSDLVWFLRDLLGARDAVFTWASPRQLLRSLSGQGGSTKFARVLCAVYGASALLAMMTLVRWSVEGTQALAHLPLSSLLPSVLLSAAFMGASIIATLVSRRRQLRDPLDHPSERARG